MASSQQSWRWCKSCDVLAYSDMGAGRCPGGSYHDFSASGNYHLHHSLPREPASWQGNWKYCDKCKALCFSQHGSLVCAAGGAHAAENATNASHAPVHNQHRRRRQAHKQAADAGLDRRELAVHCGSSGVRCAACAKQTRTRALAGGGARAAACATQARERARV